MVGVDLLSFALGSTLVYPALSDEPDAIVIATEDFGTVAWQNDIDLIDVLSSTPTVLLSRRIRALLTKQATSLLFAPSFRCRRQRINCLRHSRLRWRA
jgi:hypothetical protein